MMTDLTMELEDLDQLYTWDEQEGRRHDEISHEFPDQVPTAPSEMPLPETIMASYITLDILALKGLIWHRRLRDQGPNFGS